MLQRSPVSAIGTTSRGTALPCSQLPVTSCSRLSSHASTSSAPFTSSTVPPRPQASVSRCGLTCTRATAGEQAAPAPTGTPDRRTGRNSYRPNSFQEMVADATTSVLDAIADGHKRLEVEFPPLPVAIDGKCYKMASQTRTHLGPCAGAGGWLALAQALNTLGDIPWSTGIPETCGVHHNVCQWICMAWSMWI